MQVHIKAIFDLPTMSRENSKELRQISDGASRHILALKALQRPVDSWDDLLIHIFNSKLDSITLKEWQASLKETQIPTFQQFKDFIMHRSQVLEGSSRTNTVSVKKYDTRSQYQGNTKSQSTHVATFGGKCLYCHNGQHAIYSCKEFLALSVLRRIAEVRKRRLYLNCLRFTGHLATDRSSSNCRVCQAKQYSSASSSGQGRRQMTRGSVLRDPSNPARFPSPYYFQQRLFMCTTATVRGNHVVHYSIAAHRPISSHEILLSL